MGKVTEHYNLIAVSGTHGKKILFRHKSDSFLISIYVLEKSVKKKIKETGAL